MLRKAEQTELEQLYKHLVLDFPEQERRDTTLDLLKENARKESIQVFFYEEEQEKKGYTILRQINQITLIQFFAIFPLTRGKGVGSRFLKELLELLFKQKQKDILLEVEIPQIAISQQEYDIRQRRISFYEKQGFNILENVEYSLYGLPLFLMYYTRQKEDKVEEKVQKALEFFYSSAKKENQLKIEKITK